MAREEGGQAVPHRLQEPFFFMRSLYERSALQPPRAEKGSAPPIASCPQGISAQWFQTPFQRAPFPTGALTAGSAGARPPHAATASRAGQGQSQQMPS